MAKTRRIKITKTVEKLLCVNAGGRCEFEGCNKLLTVDKLTQKVQDSGMMAHIVAASDHGPRGNSELSEEERSKIENLMLLCYECHRRIDHEKVELYSTEKLLAMKEAHEKRIRRSTAITPSLSTHLIFFSTPIQGRTSRISLEDAKDAVLGTERYPEEDFFVIRGDELGCDEETPTFMERVNSLTRDKLGTLIKEAKSTTGKIVTSLSVFALGTIPALINLGYLLGDLINVDIYQKKRNDNWIWDSGSDEGIPDDYFKLASPLNYKEDAAVNISLSGIITDEKIYAVLGKDIPICHIKIDSPQLDFLQTKTQFEHFERSWNLLLSVIRKQNLKKLHIFCAIPSSLAVLIGRTIHKKIDPEIFIYDLSSSGDHYEWKWTINERS